MIRVQPADGMRWQAIRPTGGRKRRRGRHSDVPAAPGHAMRQSLKTPILVMDNTPDPCCNGRMLGQPNRKHDMRPRASGSTACALPFAILVLSALASLPAAAQTEVPPLNTWGTPGMVDMPSATPMPDGRISGAFTSLGPLSRTAFGFQAGPRVAGGFRYTRAEGLAAGGADWADAAFDLRLTLLLETAARPAVTLGFQDILGTGLSSGEYLVATKSLGSGIAVSAGLGWGRFGQAGTLSDGGSRPPLSSAERPDAGAWFSGPAAAFAGVTWAATDRLTLALEYSADRYDAEVSRGLIDRPAPWNAGLSYRVADGVRMGVYTLGGTEVGLSLTMALDPKGTPALGPRIGAPPPVIPRGVETHAPGTTATLGPPLARALAADGMRLEGFRIDGTTAELRLSNLRHEAWPQALGRAARTLTRGLPPEIETLKLVPVEGGLPVSSVRLTRSDLEALETAPDGTERLRARAVIGEAPAGPALVPPGTFPRLSWGLSPYLRARVFQGTDAGRGEVGLRLSGAWQPSPGLTFAGTISGRAAGTLDGGALPAATSLPRVRTDAARFDAINPRLDRLTVDWRGRPAPAFHARAQAGYLEPMFAGVAGEVLWKPVDSRLALGLELAQVIRRDPGGAGLDLGDYETVTGHASAYWDFGDGVTGRLDAGRYLAGDWGGTVALDRTFANGWRVGIFATLTDADWAEVPGGFDRGVTVTIPTAWFRGDATRASTDLAFGGRLSDAGQRLSLSGRLYDSASAADAARLDRDWGRFWR